jgi:anti-sigma B factor antagonist
VDFGIDVDETHPPYAVVSVSGEVDVATAPELRHQLLELVSAGKTKVIVNLGAVGFLDSTGLGVLVSTVKRLRSDGGDLAVICASAQILRVFEITGLTSVFAIHDTLAAALAG